MWLRSLGWQTFVSEIILIASIAAILYVVIGRMGKRSANDIMTLAVAGIMYAYIMISFAPNPSDRIHLVEYSLLAILLYYALKFDVKTKFVYITAWSMSAIVGFVDEMIQSQLSTRTYDLNDMMINAMAAAVALVTVGFVIEDGGGSGD